ncbi:hypothetical protein RCS94_06680 [Orbaceae bacterium ac157xtp]
MKNITEEKIFKKIERAVNSLNDAMEELKRIYPNAYYYVTASDAITVMRGDSHSRGGEPQRENELADFSCPTITGGDY